MEIKGDNVNYWSLGDINIRSAVKADAAMFREHFRTSPAWIERAFDKIKFPPGDGDVEQWLWSYCGGISDCGSAGNGSSGGGSTGGAVESGSTGGGSSGGGAAGNASANGSAGNASASGDDRRVFVIEETRNGGFIGYIDVWEADARNGVFKTGIKMLDGYAGKGYATRAFIRVLGFYFDELRYQKCDVYIYEFNKASLRFHDKLGFVREGVRRREYYSNGRYYDAVCLGLTAEEFRESRELFEL